MTPSSGWGRPVEFVRCPEGFDEELCAEFGQAHHERVGGVLLRDGRAHGADHRTRVKAQLHLHEHDAAFRISGLDGARNGRGAAPAGQKAAVDVDGADVAVAADALGAVENSLRKNEAVCGHDEQVGADGLEVRVNAGGLFGCLLQAQRDRRDDGNAVLKGELLDGRGSELHAAAARAVGLRENEGDLVSRRQ